GRQLGDETVGVATETEEVDELARFGPLGALTSRGRREPQQRAPERCRAARFERELDCLAHRQLGKQGGGLKGAAETDACALMGGESGDVAAQQLDAA